MTRQWHVAQINVGTIKYPAEDPRMQGFMSRLDEINAIADTTPGFVWRLQSESGNATDIDVGGPALFIANMSVWESVEVLFDYVYRTTHRELMVKRRDWFEKPSSIYQALWWVPAGHVPSVEEGLERIERLKKHGPTPEAFTFKSRYPAPGCDESPDDLAPDEYCSGWD
ncbi:MAG: DUF3291 domain-containing protein [Pseudomonadota bacterium]